LIGQRAEGVGHVRARTHVGLRRDAEPDERERFSCERWLERHGTGRRRMYVAARDAGAGQSGKGPSPRAAPRASASAPPGVHPLRSAVGRARSTSARGLARSCKRPRRAPPCGPHARVARGRRGRSHGAVRGARPLSRCPSPRRPERACWRG
jgi:hypothetical protein